MRGSRDPSARVRNELQPPSQPSRARASQPVVTAHRYRRRRLEGRGLLWSGSRRGARTVGGNSSGPSPDLHSNAVTAQNIAQALAYINWVVLCSLALGSFALAWALRQSTDVTKGYVSFTTGTAAVLGLLLFFSDQSLPAPTLIKVTAAPELDGPRRAAILVFTALAFVVALRVRGGHRSWWLGVGAIAAGTVTEGLAAIGWAGDALHGVPLLVQFLMLSAVTGGAIASVILAHWYLVTPRISEQPLIL